MKMAPGDVIRDRYRLVEHIAIGSTSDVWRATDSVLGRSVAVKILGPEGLADRTFRERFRAEARHAAQLSHPGVAEVHDYGELDDLAFLVMEYLPGQSLAAILDRSSRPAAESGTQRERTLGVETTMQVIAQVARALQAAHDFDLVHRDIKPANLIVKQDGSVKITDFGTSRALNASTVTEPGVVVGTAQYLSPEQAAGRPVTPAADIYAVGAVAYTCLAGKPPFDGPFPVEVAAAHVHEDPPPLSGTIPAPVRELVESCLAKNPEDRPESAAEVARRCAASSTAPARGTHSGAGPRRRPAPLSAATAGAALAVAGMVLLGPGNEFLPFTTIGDRVELGWGDGSPTESTPAASSEASAATGRSEAATPSRWSPGRTTGATASPRDSRIRAGRPRPASASAATASPGSSAPASSTDPTSPDRESPSASTPPGSPTPSPAPSGATREQAPSPSAFPAPAPSDLPLVPEELPSLDVPGIRLAPGSSSLSPPVSSAADGAPPSGPENPPSQEGPGDPVAPTGDR